MNSFPHNRDHEKTTCSLLQAQQNLLRGEGVESYGEDAAKDVSVHRQLAATGGRHADR